MSRQSDLSWNDYLALILSHYSDKPDDYSLTLGDFSGSNNSLPEYRGFMKMRLGDLRNLSKEE